MEYTICFRQCLKFWGDGELNLNLTLNATNNFTIKNCWIWSATYVMALSLRLYSFFCFTLATQIKMWLSYFMFANLKDGIHYLVLCPSAIVDMMKISLDMIFYYCMLIIMSYACAKQA